MRVEDDYAQMSVYERREYWNDKIQMGTGWGLAGLGLAYGVGEGSIGKGLFFGLLLLAVGYMLVGPILALLVAPWLADPADAWNELKEGVFAIAFLFGVPILFFLVVYALW